MRYKNTWQYPHNVTLTVHTWYHVNILMGVQVNSRMEVHVNIAEKVSLVALCFAPVWWHVGVWYAVLRIERKCHDV